jgi:sec-independent protein translocase protein TatB
MSAPGFWEIVTLAVIALLIFGPDKLPGMARTVGKTIGQVRREARATMNELRRAADFEELRQARRELSEATAEVERQANLGDPLGRPDRRRGRVRDEPAATAPPPFDPDAT